MSSRSKDGLREVVHIVVFDYENEMVAKEKEEPFSYKYQKEYFLGDKKIGERKYNSSSKTTKMRKNQLDSLKEEVNKLLQKPFSYVSEDSGVEVMIKGGSSIYYVGEKKEEFLTKVLKLKMDE